MDLATLRTHYNRVILGLLLLAIVMVVGTSGYISLEGWSFLDALYMTVITVTTVGYREVRPLDESGEVFTLFLLFFGVGSAFYILTALVAAIIEGDLGQIFGVRRMQATIQRLKDHHIICGYGRVGQEIVREFRERDAPFVIVDRDAPAVERARSEGLLAITGDATHETTLQAAGIERCASLLAACDSDSTNTYITLTAKLLRSDAYVIARVGAAANEPKLLQAGADRVISPHQMGGRRMAVSALQPVLLDFIDIVAAGTQSAGILGDVAVEAKTGLAGRTLAEVFRDAPDVTVLAIRSARGTIIVGPAPTTRLALGDRLMLFGSEEQVEKIRSFAGPRRPATTPTA
jgi:voltage-gated potassium channel